MSIEKPKKVLIDLQYLPNLEYFGVLLHADEVKLEAKENYVKQSYRNRCRILTANGVDVLSVPVHKSGKKNQATDVEIDYTQKWVQRHWRAIKSSYGKAPFFEYYSDGFQEIFEKKIPLLFDFNQEMLSYCLKALQMDVRIGLTGGYEKIPETGVIDMRSKISPKASKNRENGFYKALNYHQVFGSNFVENLSIIDLIFNEGTGAKEIIEKSSSFSC